MWCRDCHKEVNALADAGGMTCPLCLRTLAPAAGRQLEAIRHAREILERWQSSDLFERITSTGPLTSSKQQDRAPLLNIPLSQSVPRMTATPRPSAIVQAREEFRDRDEIVLEHSPSESAPASPSVVKPDDSALKPESKLAETGVAGVFRVPRNGAVARESEPTRLRDVEIPSPESEASRVSNDATAEHGGDRTKSDSIRDQHRPARANHALDRAEDSLLRASMPSVAPLVAKHTLPEPKAPVANNFEALFAPLLAAAAPPLDEAESHEAPPLRQAVQAADRIDDQKSEHSDQVLESDSENAAASQDVSLLAENDTFRSAIANSLSEPAVAAASSEKSSQSGISLFSETVAIQDVSVLTRSESAETAKHADVDGTKKKQRAPLRRPPLHRRFQLDRPDPVPSLADPSPGTEAMSRKFRVDQPGGAAESGQAKAQESIASSVAPETKIVSNSAAGGRRLRIDTAESVEDIASTTGRRERTQGRARDRYIDDAHESVMRGPHFEINAPKKSNLTSMTGQFLAYMGVLGLTIGTAMVIYGHFGGYAEYTPTGWLVTTVAQMLLFLGVINLVSGGIEQNNEDVSRRINTLGDQLLRIEQVTSEVLRGPKISPRVYDDPEAAAAATSKETVGIDRD
jgi:hypothetical protein